MCLRYINSMGSNMEGNWQLLQQEAEKPIISKATMSFKRTFPFDQAGKVLIGDATSADELLLEQSKGQYTGVKLMRGLWDQHMGQSSGTFFPVAAPAGSGVLWGSAGHCLMPDVQERWRCGYGTQVQPYSPSSQQVARFVVDLSWLRDGSELVEYVPSQPTRRIGAADVMPDFGFMLAKAPEGGMRQLYIPSARQLACGDPVCLLGFAHRPTADWARTFLRTEADYDQAVEAAKMAGQPQPSPADWRLNDHSAANRALDLMDGVCYPNLLAASPGMVAGASQRIIEHTCSTFPGMSGAPGIDTQHPWQLLFVHTRADHDFRCNNYGYSVHHPLFIKAYEREVLPRLLATPSDLLSPEMLRCLHGYLDAHKDQLADSGVLRQVEQRC